VGVAGRDAPDIASKLTAHAHLGEGAATTLGLAYYTELVAVWGAWLCALHQPARVVWHLRALRVMLSLTRNLFGLS
jgi:hypothetical protein